MNNIKILGRTFARLDEKPAEVEKTRAGFANNEPREHKWIKSMPPCYERTSCKYNMMEDSVEATDARIKTKDMKQVGEQVGGEDSISSQSTVNFDEVGEIRWGEGRNNIGWRTNELKERGSVD